jgi:RNA polymerase sigma-70 factor (ECF subfamily)
MERETETALVTRLRAGDPDAFDIVFDAYHVRRYSFLARLSRRRDVAEDLLDETWMRLVAHASRLEGETRLGPWLYTVARNLYYSYCRSRALDDARGVGLISLWPGGHPPPSPFEEAAARELERRLERALAALPAASREILLLVSVEGLTPSEAAVVCGVSQEALRQRLSRARAMLSQKLDSPTASPAAAPGAVTT